jgi:hypothetical protein
MQGVHVAMDAEWSASVFVQSGSDCAKTMQEQSHFVNKYLQIFFCDINPYGKRVAYVWLSIGLQ